MAAYNAKKYVFRRNSDLPFKMKLLSDLLNMQRYAKTMGNRIYENQHLLDATEIFRKLNVHKKV